MTRLETFLQHGENEYTHKKLGLERVRQVLEQLGSPEKTFPSVLIAGTNGKGSVGRMLESVLLKAGYGVGLYTSPHLERFTERIRIGGKEISEAELEEVLAFFVEQGVLDSSGQMKTAQGVPLTWFEKTTLLAFEIFRRRQIPLALLEVGLGARLDATNVVEPIVSVITSIGRDHTEVLGDSLFEIAREKLAVLRPGRPLVIGLMNTNLRTFLQKAARMSEARPVLPAPPKGSCENFSYGPFEKLSLGLEGKHQLSNAATAIEVLVALKEAGFEIQNQHVREGLSQVHFPGRMETFLGAPNLLLDGAHNEASLQALVDYLQAQVKEKPITIVLGMMQDKDAKAALKILSALKANMVFTQAPSPRSLSIEQWQHLLKFQPGISQVELIEDPLQALAWARENTPSEGWVVVTGSLYLVGKVRSSCQSLV